MQKRRIFGYFLIILGLIVFFIKPLGNLTGFAITENISIIERAWFYIMGLVLMTSGIILTSISQKEISDLLDLETETSTKVEPMYKQHGIVRPGSMGPNTIRNKQAKYWMKKCYEEEYRRSPTKEQFDNYLDENHPKINEMITDIRKRYRKTKRI